MSFILDALKKSESDRQRQSGPSLFEVKVAPPRRALPIWAVAIAGLLAINVIVISWMLLRHPAAQQAAAPAPESPPAAVAARSASAPDTVPARAGVSAGLPGTAASGPAVDASRPPSAASPPPSTATAPQAPARAATSSKPSPAAPLAGAPGNSGTQEVPGGDPGDTAPAVEPSAAQGSGAPEDTGGDLPLYQQVVASAGLPELHLDLHVFAERPQDRFVMINMHRLAEGGSLPNGVRVEAIRPDGVVLSYHGTQFLLPRS